MIRRPRADDGLCDGRKAKFENPKQPDGRAGPFLPATAAPAAPAAHGCLNISE